MLKWNKVGEKKSRTSNDDGSAATHDKRPRREKKWS